MDIPYMAHVSLCFFNLNPKTLVAVLSPEAFVMKVNIFSFRNIDIYHQTVIYLISN
ncbi:hypothetical protein HOLleu_44303 [Holothuria leucospilota]|uniref:Uncharacterized protein n=1 Tax=Holothuria leucospilota TaxID=206669 RepID=A0A9Q0Y8X6_HOLLE|nr:hypothetical protein HOLleu_44303 [Holothuria leucospilota]